MLFLISALLLFGNAASVSWHPRHWRIGRWRPWHRSHDTDPGPHVIKNCMHPRKIITALEKSEVGVEYSITCPEVCGDSFSSWSLQLDESKKTTLAEFYVLPPKNKTKCIPETTFTVTLEKQKTGQLIGVPSPNPWNATMDVRGKRGKPHKGTQVYNGKMDQPIDAGCYGAVGPGCVSFRGSPASLAHDTCTLHYAMALQQIGAVRGIRGFQNDFLCGHGALRASGEWLI